MKRFLAGLQHIFASSRMAIGRFVVLLCLVVGAGSLSAATTYTWTGTTSTAWATTTNWTPNGNPGSATGDIVNIPTTTNKPVLTISPANSIASVSFSGSAAQLTVTGATLTVSGAVTLNNTANANSAVTITGTGSLNCGSIVLGNGTAPSKNNTAYTHTLTTTINLLTVTNGITLNSYFATTNCRGNAVFTQTSGTVTVNGTITTANANTANISTFTLGSTNPTLNLGGTTPFTISGTGTSTITLNGTGATVNYSYLGAQTVLPTTYSNLTLSGTGTKTYTVAAARTTNTLTVNTGVTLALNGTSSLTPVTANVSGTISVSNTASLAKGTGIITFNSGSTYNHACDGGVIPTATWNAASTCNVTGITATSPTGLAQTFGNFIWNCTDPSGTVATTGNITVNGNFTLTNGDFALNNGTSNTLTIAGNYVQTGGTFDFNAGASGTSTMYLAGNFSNTAGAASITTSGNGAPNGGVVFNGTGAQSFNMPTAGAAIWATYTINSGSSVQLLSNFDLQGSPAVTFYASVTVNGTLDVGTYTISDNNSNSSGGSVFTLNSGGTLITANTGGVDGTFPSAFTTTSFNAAANYIFNGALSQVTGASFTGANNLTINNTSAVVTASRAVTVSGALAIISGGTLDMGTYQLLGALSTITNNGIIQTQNTSATPIPSGKTWGGTVQYNATTGAQTVMAGTYNNLTLSNTSGIETASGALTVNGVLTTTASGTLNMGTNQLLGTLTTVTNNGTIQTQNTSATPIPSGKTWGGTVIFNGTSNQTIPASTFNNIIVSNSVSATLSGIVTANLFSVTNTSSSAILGGSATAYINGPLSWTLPAGLASGSTYNFPVGNTSYLPFSLVNPTTGATGPVIQVQAYNADASSVATFDATITSISHSEYWALSVISGNFTNSSVSLTRQSAISPFDAIGASTAQTGSYSSLAGTIGTNGITASNSIGSSRFFVFAAKPISISTSTITGSPFCPGSSVSVPYTITGTFTTGNVFTAQLSDASGSFVSPVAIGTLTSTAAGTISATIPAGTSAGTGYRIRVISSNPAKTGTDNGSNLTVVASPGAPTTTGANICIGTPNGTTLSASGAISGQKYVWYNVATGGTALKTSTDDTDNTYTTPTLAATTSYWVSIMNTGGCEGVRTQVTATYPATSTDDQSAAGTDSWIGHVYYGTNRGIAYNGTFTNYYGHYTENEAFDESFGGNTTCFNITSNSITQSIYTQTFSVRYRMNSTKKGLYTVNMGSDDGNRLTIDGTKIYDDWSDHGVNNHANVLMNLTGSSYLLYDYYENGGGNRVYFNNLTLILANTLNANTSQNIYIGNSGAAISGDTYGTLPSGVTLSGTGYQWTYSTTPTGTRTAISGATGATFTPNTTTAPFNTAGTYYVFRNAVLSSANNVSPNPYVATNESNMATVVIRAMPTITTSISALSGFTYPVNNGPSAYKTFTVSGTGLLTNIDVSMPVNSNYELSIDGTNYFANVIVMINAGGVASATTVYVRLKAGLAINTSYPDVITASSVDAASKTVTLAGSVTDQPLITVTPSSLTGLSYVLGYGPSTAQTFSVSGANLQNIITITAPTDFEISKTSATSGFGASTTLTPTSGTVNATTIWVRLKAGLSTSTYNEDVTLTTPYADSKTVNCQGVVNRATINVSNYTLAGFIYTLNNGPSSVQTFTVSGSSLSANIAIAASTNFEISSNNSTWVTYPNSLTLPQSGGVVNTTTIYVRMKAGLAIGVISPENLLLTTTNAIAQSVACSGAVTSGAATISSNPTLNGFFYIVGHGPSVTQSFTVSGTSLGTNQITVAAPTDFEVSPSGSIGTFVSSFTITPTGGKVNASLVYIRLKGGLSVGTYIETVTLSSAVTTNVSVACKGKVVDQPTIVAGPSNPYNLCSGDAATLTSSGTNISSQSWTGPNNFTSTNQNPSLGTVTSTNSGVYTVTGNVASGINLLTNGDFESGNTGFGSTYTYNAASGTYGSYWIYNNPNTANATYFINGTDHTTGSGLLMIVDGSETSGAIVWSETISVNPNTNYQFSYWAENINSQGNTNYAHLQLYVNNVPVGPVNTITLTSWLQFLCSLNSGSSTSLQLTLINTSVGGSGNDFGLDDIFFEQVFQVSDAVTLNVTPKVTPSVSIVASANPTTTGATVTFTATPTNGGATPTYVWYKNNAVVPGVTSSTYSYIPANGDNVYCIMTTSVSCYTALTATSNTITMTVTNPINLWKGSTSTDWGTASNWTANFIPNPGNDITFATVANYGSVAVNDLVLDQDRTQGSLINQTTKNLIIPAGKSLTINNTITTDNSVDRIYIKSSSTSSNGSLIFYSNNPVYGIVEMYSKAYKGSPVTVSTIWGNVTTSYRWQYFGIPLNTVTANPTFYGSYVRSWNEAGDSISNHWVDLINESVLQPFYGYEITQDIPINTGKTIYYQGQLVNWDWTSPQLPKTGAALFPGQHIFANPYTAAIDIKKIVFGTSMEFNVYLYSTGAYGDWNSHTTTDSINPGQYQVVSPLTAGQLGIPSQIPSMQAFLVQVNTADSYAYVNIPYNSVVKNTAEQRAKKIDITSSSDKIGLRINIVGNKSADKMWLFSDSTCTRGFDNGWDGRKMMGSSLSPQLYAIEADGKYQIDCVADINNTQLGFQAGRDSVYTMTFNQLNIKNKYAGVYLLDVAEKKCIDITEPGSSYTFTAVSSPVESKRFKIISVPIEQNGNEQNSMVKIFSSNGTILAQNLTNASGEIIIYDIVGHYLQKKPLVPNGITTISGLIPGVYVAKTNVGGDNAAKKLIVR